MMKYLVLSLILIGACSSQEENQTENFKSAVAGTYQVTTDIGTVDSSLAGVTEGTEFTIESDGNFSLNLLSFTFDSTFSDTQADYKVGSRYLMITLNGKELQFTKFVSSKEDINRFDQISVAVKK